MHAICYDTFQLGHYTAISYCIIVTGQNTICLSVVWFNIDYYIIRYVRKMIWFHVWCDMLLQFPEIPSAIFATVWFQSNWFAPFCLWLAPARRLIVPMKCINIISFRKPSTWQRSLGADHVTAASAMLLNSRQAEWRWRADCTGTNHAGVSRLSLSLLQVVHQVGRHLHRSLRAGPRPLHGGDKWQARPVVQLQLHCRGSVCGGSTALSCSRQCLQKKKNTDKSNKKWINEDSLILRLIKLFSRANNYGLLHKVTGLMKRVLSFSALLNPMSLCWCSDNVSAS